LPSITVQALALNSSRHIFAGTGRGVFRSTDDGDSWTLFNDGLTSKDVRSLAVNSSGHIFAGTTGAIFRSTDNGVSWTPGPISYPSARILSLAVDASGQIFAGTDVGAIFRSADNGDSWTRADGGLTTINVWSLLTSAKGEIFAGTYESGVLRSTDSGASWTPLNAGLTNMNVRALAISPSGDFFAGTAGNGVFRRVELATSVRETTAEAPASFALEQNYPNPFWSEATSRLAGNPSTSINYQLLQAAPTSLTIYNMLGQEVRKLVNTQQPAGYHTVVWDGRDNAGRPVPSGVYHYRLQAGSFTMTKRMLMAK
jgi:photosystem II stability/assembly factor-like uncharacterized protein